LDDPDIGRWTRGEDAFLPGWVQCPLAEPGAALHLVASPEEQLFRTLASEQRLGTPPVRTLAECLSVLDLAEGERRGKQHDAGWAGAARTARGAAAAHAGRAQDGDAAGAAGAQEKARQPAERDAAHAVPAVGSLAARLYASLYERADRTSVLTQP